jgi:salicylate hydroxylase
MIQTAQIAGAGIGGLATALALARAGVSVEVHEQARELIEVGAGLQLSPNACKALSYLGILEAVRAVAFEPETVSVRHYRTGARLFNAPLKGICDTRYGAPYLHIHRADLLSVLEDAARTAGVHVHLGCPVSGASEVALELGGRALDPADLVVGADGIRSAVGRKVIGDVAPDFTGQVAWRGVIRADCLPKGAIEPGATAWIGPGRHMVTYYLRAGTLLNFVAVEERDDWRDDGWTQPGDLAELRRAFGDWHPGVSALVNAVDQTFLWALFGRPELPRWSKGSVVLIGDACHPTLPFMAQGAAMAIEDAVVLCRCVQAFDVPTALARFEAARKPRCSALQQRARSNAEVFHLSGGAKYLVNRAKLGLSWALPGSHRLMPFDSIYGYDLVTAPI